jgi:hypothetical protein
MNENLIPQVIVDLVQKYMRCEDIHEKYSLEMRINDVARYLDSALTAKKQKKDRQSK